MNLPISPLPADAVELSHQARPTCHSGDPLTATNSAPVSNRTEFRKNSRQIGGQVEQAWEPDRLHIMMLSESLSCSSTGCEMLHAWFSLCPREDREDEDLKSTGTRDMLHSRWKLVVGLSRCQATPLTGYASSLESAGSFGYSLREPRDGVYRNRSRWTRRPEAKVRDALKIERGIDWFGLGSFRPNMAVPHLSS